MIFSPGPPKRRSFQKGLRRDMIFLVLSEKMVYLFLKTWYVFLGRKPAMTFLKKYMEIWYILCTRVGVTSLVSRPLPKKKSRMVLFRINTPKGNWCSRLTSWKELQQFSVPSQGPLQAFSYIALQRKKLGNLIYRIEVWLHLQFIWLEIFCNE